MTSVISKNLFSIMSKFLRNILSIFNEDFMLSKYVRKFKKQFRKEWRSNLIFELLKMRDGSFLFNLSLNKINLLLKELCTK